MQEGKDQRQQVTRYLSIALSRGVDAVGLHAASSAVDILKQKGKQGYVILLSQRCVDFIELADVIRAVVRRQGDPAEHDLCSRVPQSGDDLIEILPCAVDGQAAKTIVAAEGDDDERRLQGEHVIQPFDAVLRRVAADAGIRHAIVKAFGVEILLKKIGITVAGIGTVARSQAVAEGNDDRAIVTGLSCRLRRYGTGCRGSLRRRSRLSVAAGNANDEQGDNREPPMGTARVHHTFNLAADGNLAADRRQDEGTRRKGAA
jgi:hypothetical protein